MAIKFPCLFDLDKRKSCFIAERMGTNKITWDWKKKPNRNLELFELSSLTRLLEQVKLSIGQDKWKSKLSGDGCFYIG